MRVHTQQQQSNNQQQSLLSQNIPISNTNNQFTYEDYNVDNNIQKQYTKLSNTDKLSSTVSENSTTTSHMVQKPNRYKPSRRKYKILSQIRNNTHHHKQSKQKKPSKMSRNNTLVNYYLTNKFNKFLMTGIIICIIAAIIFINFVTINKNAHKYTTPKIRMNKPINIKHIIQGYSVKQLQLNKYYQVSTQLDFLKVELLPQHKHFVKNYQKYIRYEIYSCHPQTYNISQSSSNIKSSHIQKLTHNTNISQAIEPSQIPNIAIIRQYPNHTQGHKSIKNQFTYKPNINQQQPIYNQYQYYNNIYKLNNIQYQSSICMVSYLQSISQQQQLIETYSIFLHTISKQNYTNYTIILIDDHPTHNLSQKIYSLYRNNPILLPKITIIRNYQYMGTTGSLYYHRKHCLGYQIVGYIHVYGRFVGTYVFNVINAVYKDSNIWMAYTQPFNIQRSIIDNISSLFKKDKSNYMHNQSYRLFSTGYQIGGFITHRTQLLLKLPIGHFMQYQYNYNSLSIKPVFYNSKYNKFLTYLLIQLCTPSHIKFINSSLYQHNTQYMSKQLCFIQKQKIYQMKARIKRPMKPLIDIYNKQEALTKNQTSKDIKIAQNILKQYVQSLRAFHECEQRQNQQEKFNKQKQRNLNKVKK